MYILAREGTHLDETLVRPNRGRPFSKTQVLAVAECKFYHASYLPEKLLIVSSLEPPLRPECIRIWTQCLARVHHGEGG